MPNEKKNYDEVLADFGIESEEDVKLDGRSNFFEFPLGEHTVLVGDLIYKYKDVDDKACKKGDPGARLSFAQQQFLVIKLGDVLLIDEQHNLIGDKLPPPAYRYSQYVSFEPDRQFGNKLTFNSFYIDDKPELSIVKDTDGGKFSINLKVAPLYKGFPATMTITESKGRGGNSDKIYKNAKFELNSHTLTKELVTARAKLVAHLNAQVDNKWDEQKAENAKEKTSETATSADSVDGLMDDLYD